MTPPLLDPDEPQPATLVNETGASVFFLTCDHGGRAIPRRLERLGLAEPDTCRHIAWDIGIAEVGQRLSAALDAALIAQTYSRLVIDGNRNLSEANRAARRDAIFRPYQDGIAAALDRRAAEGRVSVLIALHSFTPVFRRVPRPWHVGVLFNRDARLAHPLLELLRAEGDLTVGENEPYRVTDLTDFTVPVHGERRGLPHVEIEIRQDLIAEPAGQAAWGERLARLLPDAYSKLRR
jgi:predicted N-formylglutamate amidohydrolase